MGTARGTTPTFVLHIPGVDLTHAANVYVSIIGTSFGGYAKREITITTDDLNIEYSEDETTISVKLSQEDSLAFAGSIELQANWTYPDGSRCATYPAAYAFGKQLLNKVVE